MFTGSTAEDSLVATSWMAPGRVTIMADLGETFVSIDVETSGPTPGDFSLLSIGACLVDDDDDDGFYVELQPDSANVVASALAISGLDLATLAVEGAPPGEAMASFETWVTNVVPEGSRPVFVGFNASFDWMFVAEYFQRHLGRNPFGHAALDMKSFAMGMTGSTWAETSMRILSPRYLDGHRLTHNALDDARDQARMFRALLDEAARHR